MQPVRWGVLGAAKFAREQMARAIHAAEGAELAALATSSVEKAAGFTAFAPGLTMYSEYDALLGDPSLDAVYIPLPNHLHVEWALKALEAGKHALVEKPLGLHASDFDAVIAKRDTSGLLAAEAFMIVFHPQWQRVRALIADGAIGPLRHVEPNFTYDNRADPGNIRNSAATGGGALPDIGVYTCGAVRFATGLEPEAVLHSEITWEEGVDVFSHCSARFPGFTFSGLVSMRMERRQSVTFHGERGLIKLPCPFNPLGFGAAELRLTTEKNVTRVETWPEANQYVLQVEAFCRSVREGAPYPCPLEFSKGTQAMIDAIYDAALRNG
ncbi:MAG: Gfo/Idh/MocA family oxidoreductase [Pseudomonadota bacterium]